MSSAHKHKRASLWRAVVGLVLIGAGASTVGYTAALFAASAPPVDLFMWGTLGLVVLNTGVSFFGDAVKHATLAELRAESASDRSAE